MKAQQDIEQQLAEAQGAWETAPAPELWDRLEQRLDAQAPADAPRRPRRWPFRVVMVALLATAGVGLWWVWPTTQAAAPKGKAFTAHTTTIDLSGLMADAQTEQSLGQPANRLTFSGNIGIGNSRLGLGSQPVIGPKLKPLAAESRQSIFSMNGSGRLLLNGSTSAASPTYNGNISMSQINPVIVDASTMNMSLPMVVSNSVGNPIDTVGSLQQFRSLGVIQDNAYLQLNAATNHMNFNYVNPARAQDNRQNLQHLKWLLGNWKTQGTSGGAMEEWRQKDDFTMVGRGYFVVNGDTIVTEEMRIEQRGPNVYFIIVKDQNQRSMKFRLRSSQPNELIFENDAPKSEEEIVLRNRPGTDEVERIYQKTAAKPQAGNTSVNPAPYKAMKVMQRK